MLVPLNFPPGVFANGTDLQGTGRWIDASLVRWREGAMKPVGGWRQRIDTALDAAPRGAIAWEDLAGDRHLVFATYDTIYEVSAVGTVSDITPAGLTSGIEVASVNTGYGGGFYGTAAYGVTRPDYGNFSEATTWSLDTWGEYLIACSVSDGTIYEWQLDTGTPAAAVSNAPTNCLGCMVTEEAFLVALGADGNPRSIAWSDQGDNTTWTASATNQAGSVQLQTQGQIMAGLKTRGQALILTDADAHTLTYIGTPFVYDLEKVGSDCGLVARRAAAVIDGGAIWMGARGFYYYGGGAVQSLPCELSDFIFSDINPGQRSQIHAVKNAQHNEVWWFYPSEESGVCDRYITFNYAEKHWSKGALSRSAGVDRGVFKAPIWAGENGMIYDHETGLSRGGQEAFAQSGPISPAGGDVFSAMSMIPDERTQGDMSVSFKARFYPNGDETEFGPYDPAEPTDLRITARQLRLRVTGDDNKDWRCGINRIRIAKRGRR